jgi:hypothetical protein
MSFRSDAKPSLIEGGGRSSKSLRLRLHPIERREEKENCKPARNPAEEIPCRPPDRTPKTSKTLKHTNPTFIGTTMHSPRSGAFPSPTPTGYSGEEDIRSARPAAADSQGEDKEEETSRDGPTLLFSGSRKMN